eukprot:GHVR01119693.1.p1 GENE.GHVR01119693.1~~GHVR01119693.1.p1  ORF type:complete len:197 (+),score=25.88 GHVR01119693.1:57-647(+)
MFYINVSLWGITATIVVGIILHLTTFIKFKVLNSKRHKLPLISKIQLSSDTCIFRFGFKTRWHVLSLPIGKHVKLFAPNRSGIVSGKWNNIDDRETGLNEIVRSYTPVSTTDPGCMDLMIKIYHKGQDPLYPDGGKMSQYLDAIRLGAYVDIQGPSGLVEYISRGVFKRLSKIYKVNTVGFLAGGVGITPVLQNSQ